jgi:conjugal transfer/entry exclusion protein
MSDLKEYTNLVLHELKRIDSKIEKHDERLDKYNETLLRNTITLEHHVKGSIASNKRLKIVEDQIENLNTQVEHIDDHVTKIQSFAMFFYPTTKKLKWIVTFIGLIVSSYGLYILLTTGKVI